MQLEVQRPGVDGCGAEFGLPKSGKHHLVSLLFKLFYGCFTLMSGRPTSIPTSSWSACFWAFRENAIILVASGNLSRFRKKRFVSWNSALDPGPSPS